MARYQPWADDISARPAIFPPTAAYHTQLIPALQKRAPIGYVHKASIPNGNDRFLDSVEAMGRVCEDAGAVSWLDRLGGWGCRWFEEDAVLLPAPCSERAIIGLSRRCWSSDMERHSNMEMVQNGKQNVTRLEKCQALMWRCCTIKDGLPWNDAWM